MKRQIAFLLAFIPILSIPSSTPPCCTTSEGRVVLRTAVECPLHPATPRRTTVAPRWLYHNLNALCRRFGLSVNLVTAMIQAESNFNPRALSPRGAAGLMQLMPVVARSYGVSEPFDLVQNLQAGMGYLKQLLARYGKSVPLALAAYNAGPSAVDRYNGIPPFRETREYIRRVISQLRPLRQAEAASALTVGPSPVLKR